VSDIVERLTDASDSSDSSVQRPWISQAVRDDRCSPGFARELERWIDEQLHDQMVKPLKARTMSLSDLQLKTLDLIRKVRRQFTHQGYEAGMSDQEFTEAVLNPLEHSIRADRHVLRMAAKVAHDIQENSK
jgi:hypothetical protein